MLAPHGHAARRGGRYAFREEHEIPAQTPSTGIRVTTVRRTGSLRRARTPAVQQRTTDTLHGRAGGLEEEPAREGEAGPTSPKSIFSWDRTPSLL